VNGGNYSPVTSGSVSGALPLNMGTNTVQVKVTAQNALNANTYSISLTRLPSSNANLGGLGLSAGTLTPAFSAATNYTASVGFATKSITLTPNVAQADATIEMRANGGNYVSVASGTASSALALSVGKNTIQDLHARGDP
jgi:hypothetical protein